MNIDREQLAWAAGVFDGEGNASTGLRTTHRWITVQVPQVHPELVDRFAKVVGVGNVRGPYQPRTPNGKPYWNWSVSAYKTAQHVAAVLWPWLGSVKREQFRTALVDYRSATPERVLCAHGVPSGFCTPCRSERTRRSWDKRDRTRHVGRDNAIYEAFAGGEDRKAIAEKFGLGYFRICQIIRNAHAKEHDQ